LAPLWEKEGTYAAFLHANSWVKMFLPNAWKEKYKAKSKDQVTSKNQTGLEVGAWVLSLLEMPSRAVQLWYMQRHRTTEIIQDGMMRFHPNDARIWVKKKYSNILRRYNIPIDNVFYRR
jgi:hypothetical protein